MADQRVTVEVELRAGGNLTGALVAQRQQVERLGQAVAAARLAPQFSATGRALAVVGQQLQNVSRQTNVLGRAVRGVTGPGGPGALQRLPSFMSLVGPLLMAHRLAAPISLLARDLRMHREGLIGGQGVRMANLRGALAMQVPGAVATRQHYNSFITAQLHQAEADAFRVGQFRAAEAERAMVRRSRLTMGSPEHRAVLLEEGKLRSETGRKELKEASTAAAEWAKSMREGMAPTHTNMSGAARLTYQDITAQNRLTAAQAMIDRGRADIEIATLTPAGGAGRKGIAAQLSGGRALEALDLTRQRVGAEVELGEMGRPNVQRELQENVRLTYEAERATLALARAKALAARTEIGSPRHLQVLREQSSLQRELARNERAGRVAGMVAGGQPAFLANWQLANEGLRGFSDRLSEIGNVSGRVFLGLAGGLAGAARAASPDVWNTLSGSFGLMAGELGIVLMPIFRTVSGALQGAARWVRNLDDATKANLVTWVSWGLGVSGGLYVASRLVSVVSSVSTGLVSVASVAAQAGQAIWAFAGPVGVITGVLALSGAVATLADNFQRVGTAARISAIDERRAGEHRTNISAAEAAVRTETERMTSRQLAERTTGYMGVAQLQQLTQGFRTDPAAAAERAGMFGVGRMNLALPLFGASRVEANMGVSERMQREAIANLIGREVEAPLAGLQRLASPRTAEDLERNLLRMADIYRQAETGVSQLLSRATTGGAEGRGQYGSAMTPGDENEQAMREFQRELVRRRLAIETVMPQARQAAAGEVAGPGSDLLTASSFRPQLMAPDQLYERVLMASQAGGLEQQQLEQQIRANEALNGVRMDLDALRAAVRNVEAELRARMDFKGF